MLFPCSEYSSFHILDIYLSSCFFLRKVLVSLLVSFSEFMGVCMFSVVVKWKWKFYMSMMPAVFLHVFWNTQMLMDAQFLYLMNTWRLIWQCISITVMRETGISDIFYDQTEYNLLSVLNFTWNHPAEWNCVQNARCTAVADSFFTNYRTRELFCYGVAIFKTSPSRWGVQHPGHLKQNFESFSIGWCVFSAKDAAFFL
jgi:hypothetical protein